MLTLAELADEGSAEAEAALEAVGRFRPGKLTYTYGAHVAHVAVDPETEQEIDHAAHVLHRHQADHLHLPSTGRRSGRRCRGSAAPSSSVSCTMRPASS